MHRVLQWPWPEAGGEPIPTLYVEIDGTGVPVVAAETQARSGKQPDEPAHTREAKLGCVFTQTQLDQKGRPLRDEASTTYTGAIETAEEFGRRIFTEAYQRGWNRARKPVVLGDGAPWIWNLADETLPRCHPDRRPLPRAGPPLETVGATVPLTARNPPTLDPRSAKKTRPGPE